MDNFITVLIVNNPIELLVLRTRLEDEGIDYLIPDELTTQVNPLYNIAVGGVRLQVKQSQAEQAIALLKENGYLTEEDQTSTFISRLDKATAHLPLLKNIAPELRFLLLVGGCSVALLAVVIYLAK